MFVDRSRRTVEKAVAEGITAGIIECQRPHQRTNRGGLRVNEWAIHEAPYLAKPEECLPQEVAMTELRAPRAAAALRVRTPKPKTAAEADQLIAQLEAETAYLRQWKDEQQAKPSVKIDARATPLVTPQAPQAQEIAPVTPPHVTAAVSSTQENAVCPTCNGTGRVPQPQAVAAATGTGAPKMGVRDLKFGPGATKNAPSSAVRDAPSFISGKEKKEMPSSSPVGKRTGDGNDEDAVSAVYAKLQEVPSRSHPRSPASNGGRNPQSNTRRHRSRDRAGVRCHYRRAYGCRKTSGQPDDVSGPERAGPFLGHPGGDPHRGQEA